MYATSYNMNVICVLNMPGKLNLEIMRKSTKFCQNHLLVTYLFIKNLYSKTKNKTKLKIVLLFELAILFSVCVIRYYIKVIPQQLS